MNKTPIQSSRYQIFPFFTGTDAACVNAIYLLPPAFTYPSLGNPGNISLTIPLLFSGSNYQAYQYSNDDFQIVLQQVGGGDPSQANVYANITLLGGKNLWACAPAARAALMSNFTQFLLTIESQLEVPGVLIPGATFRISQQIADNIPAPLLETLFYRYSLTTGFAGGTVPYVDVRPGMRLRVETQVSQFITPDSLMNGYVSSGRSSYFVNSMPSSVGSSSRVVTFDPFLGTIKSPTITSGGTSPLVAGGLIDLQATAGAYKYWRLFYPQTISNASQPGDLTIKDNVTLMGAQTLTDLNNPSGTSNLNVIFLGRAIAVPEIPVWITRANQVSALEYVPVGTTLANLIERYSSLPLSPNPSLISAFIRPTSASSGGTGSSNLDTSTNLQNLTVIPPGFFDLPLIAGDNITFSF